MPSRTDIPVGSTREHLPGAMAQQSIGAGPMPVYPLDQYTAKASPPATTLPKGTKTLVPLITQAAADGISFNQFATSRIATDGSRIVPGTNTEAMHVRISMKVIMDPSVNVLVGLLDSTLRTLSNAGPFGYALNTPQQIALELDVGTTAAPNVVWGVGHTIAVFPQTIGLSVPLFGGAPFLANGARIYATASTNGMQITDVRTLLRQSRA